MQIAEITRFFKYFRAIQLLFKIGEEGEILNKGRGGDIEYFWEGGRTLYGGTCHFIGGLDNHLETMLFYLTLINI